MSIGTRIKTLREHKRLFQRVVAERAGLKQGTFSQIESGIINPRPQTVQRILTALGLSEEEIQDLLTEEKLEKLDMLDPGFVMMLKDVRNMTRDEKKSIMDAYEFVKLKRERRRYD